VPFVFICYVLVFSEQVIVPGWHEVCGAFPGVHGSLLKFCLLRMPVLISLAREILIGFYYDPILDPT